MTDPRTLIFSGTADRSVAAAVVSADSGVVAHVEAAGALAEDLGLTVVHAACDGQQVAPGEEVLRLRGTPLAIAMCDERIIGMLAKPSGIATAARAFVDRAGGRLQVVSGAWKKLPLSQKDMIRGAIAAGGAQPRITQPPFVYLDKVFVEMLGGVPAALAAAAQGALAGQTRVIQVTSPAAACEAAELGADIVFVDTGDVGDAAAAAAALTEAGTRSRVQLAFGGGITLEDVDVLREMDLDLIDVGRAIVDADLLDMRLIVLELS